MINVVILSKIFKMKKILFVLFILTLSNGWAQECDYKANLDSEVIKLKLTKEYLMWFKNIGSMTEYIEFSLANRDSLRFLNVTLSRIDNKVENDSLCLNTSTRMYLQTSNSKIAVLPFFDIEQCSKIVDFEETKEQMRTINASFLITEAASNILKESPLSFLRITNNGEVKDYVIRKAIIDPKFGIESYPENYFISQLHCVE